VEAEANRLAADLLMPRELIRQLRSTGLIDPEALTAKFGISLEAMKLRLGMK